MKVKDEEKNIKKVETQNKIVKTKHENTDNLAESKEEIKKVLEEYKISYEYTEKYRSFKVTSLLSNETCSGFKNHYIPNCVKYFGKKYMYKKKKYDKNVKID